MLEHESITPLTPQHLALHRELFQWALDNAAAATSSAPERSAGWALSAARIANTFGNDRLASPPLEHLLNRLAADIPTPCARPAEGPKRWLHVFSETYRTGGHTALAERWILGDPAEDQHSVAMTFQKKPAIPSLQEAVQRKGGQVTLLGDIASLIERATRLRQLAWETADVVVLHIHMWDVVAPLAFGIPGGPPILLLNHADHAFWVGVSVADQAIHIRESGKLVAEKWRGLNRHAYLPIPLQEPTPTSALLRAQVRHDLGIPLEAPVFLTIGTESKYTPIGALSFLSATRRILEYSPAAWIIAVGPSPSHPEWAAAHIETGGRLLAIGEQHDLHRFHVASDVYLEGFPFGSLTALLEAALAGLPCVRAPRACPPPFTSDGEALNNFPQPTDIDAYVTESLRLASDKGLRQRYGETLKAAVHDVHVGKNWQRCLSDIKARLPTSHHSYRVDAPVADNLWERYWTPFLAQRTAYDPLLYAFSTAATAGLTPRIKLRLLVAALRCGCSKRPPGMPGPISLWLFGRILSPMAGRLKYRRTSGRIQWWPGIVVSFWFHQHLGWRFEQPKGRGKCL